VSCGTSWQGLHVLKMAPPQHDTISFIARVDAHDPAPRRSSKVNWRSHTARVGHQRRLHAEAVKARARRQQEGGPSSSSFLPCYKPNRWGPDCDWAGEDSELDALAQHTLTCYGSASSIPVKLFRRPSFFQQPETADNLQFWLTKAAPFLVRGHPSRRGVLSVLVPSISLSSGIVNHIMSAHALTHRSLIQTHPSERSPLVRRALFHYIAALSGINSDRATLVERLLTSCLGWTIEGLQGNLNQSLVHLNGLQALVDKVDKEVAIRQQFRPFLEHAQAVNTALLRRLHLRPDLQTPGPFDDKDLNQATNSETLLRTETSYIWIVSHISTSRSRRSTSADHPEAKIHDGIGEYLQVCVAQYRRRDLLAVNDKETPESLLRGLNDIVSTLLPHEIVGSVKLFDLDSPERVFTTVEKCFNPLLQTSFADYLDLLGTLRVVLDLSAEIWPGQPWRACIESLARAVDICERSCLAGRKDPTAMKSRYR
jgi:hypothetical protein